MTKTVLTIPYRVSAGGYVDHWLWAGPHAIQSVNAMGKPDYLQDFRRPVEWDPPLVVDAQSYPWQYVACAADHTVHFSDVPMQPETRRYFVYAEVRQDHRGTLALQAEATGQVALWANRKQATAKTAVLAEGMIRHSFSVQVPQGRLALFLMLSQRFAGNTACCLRLQLLGDDAAGRLLTLPTAVNPERRLDLEEIIEASYITQRVYGPLEPIVLQWDSELKTQAFLGLNLRKFQGPSYMEVMHTQANARATYEMATAPIVVPGHYQVTVRPALDEYYELNQRITKVLDVFLVKSHFEQTPEQAPEERKLIMLQRAGEYAVPVLRALARAALDPQDVQNRIWRDFQEEAPKARVDLSALMSALVVCLPTQGKSDHVLAPLELLQVLQAALQHLDGAAAERGPRQAFLLSVCRLAMRERMSSECESSRNEATRPDQDRKEVHRAMREWLARGLGGWDSQAEMTQLVAACLLLATSSQAAALQELSWLLLDKVLFTLALNSWRGVYGAAGPETETVSLLDARLGALASVSYQGWGLGLPDSSFTVGMAMAHAEYEVPTAVQELGLFVPAALSSEERHTWVRNEKDSASADTEEFHRWTFKTPDFMLSSLQDFRSGQPGSWETPWLATLGYAARVHVSQPEFATEHEAVPRNFWRGNVMVPRVAQWQETVVALYGPGPRVGLGYTHAHFPQHAFDEVSISDNWAFARKDEGYLALYAANGLQAVKTGLGAFRSLRSHGQENVWVCSLSRQTWDGDFQAFQTRVRHTTKVTSSRVHVTTRSGLALAYGLQGPLTVGGDEIAQRGAMHYNSPFCQAPFPASELLIRGVSGTGLELRFA